MTGVLGWILGMSLCIGNAGAFTPESGAGSGDRRFDDRYRVVSAYGEIIESAARRFDIPAAILVGVILTESGGDPWAVTQLSSAKGLMQTIDATFEMAWTSLREQGIPIKKTPFHPESSIMAGAWYLDRMYWRAVADGQADPGLRHDPAAWVKSLEYYYAGPENGARSGSRVRVCSRGQCRIIDKSAYSAKVLAFAGGTWTVPVKTASMGEPAETAPAKLTQPAESEPAGLPCLVFGDARYSSNFQQSFDKGFD